MPKRTLPEEKGIKEKRKAANKKKAAPKKAILKKKAVKKTVIKKKQVRTKGPALSNDDLVRYKDGTTGTYSEFLVRFERRARYVMSLRGVPDKDVKEIVYVNSYVAGLRSKTGKSKLLYIGDGVDEG